MGYRRTYEKIHVTDKKENFLTLEGETDRLYQITSISFVIAQHSTYLMNT
jgi:hypothetical protein